MASLRNIIGQFVPQKYKLRYLIYKKSRRRERPIEKYLLRLLCDCNKMAVDIGANVGTVAFFLSRYSKTTHAFEINPAAARRLKQARLPNTIVHEVGLSDTARLARLRVPVANFGPIIGSGTIEVANDLEGGAVSELDVAVAALDDFQLQGVGIIKIDVEGHELPVLKGSFKTLENDRPSLIVEILERLNGNSFSDILKYTAQFSYLCYQLGGNGLFEVTIARDERGNNDYYFLQKAVADQVNATLRASSAAA